MKGIWQLVGNLAVYGFLGSLAVRATFVEPDPWFALVVWFVLLVALVITLIPGLRAGGVSPGRYPYDD